MTTYHCTIKLIGNSNVKLLEKEIMHRLDTSEGVDVLGMVLYGKSRVERLTKEETGCDWIQVDGGPFLEITCGESLPLKLLEFVLFHSSKIDPNVVISMDYQDENVETWGHYCGCVTKNKISWSNHYLDLYEIEDPLTGKKFNALKDQIRVMNMKSMD
jgi:hypothetical protein